MTKPILLLDVDGVINASSRHFPTHVWPEDRWTRFQATSNWTGQPNTYTLRIALPVIEFLSNLHHLYNVEIRWHTTWQDDVYAFDETILGLPRFAVADAPEFLAWKRENAQGWWKYPAALRAAQEGRPLIWIDDESAYSWRLSEAQREALEEATPTMIVSPDDREGLLPSHLKSITDFIRLHSESSDSDASGK